MTITTIEQCLHPSYHPDREFVDGIVIERNLGERTHSRLQGELIMQMRRFFPRETPWIISLRRLTTTLASAS